MFITNFIVIIIGLLLYATHRSGPMDMDNSPMDNFIPPGGFAPTRVRVRLVYAMADS